jgi:predicted RNA-binding Zn ribbon-like protein
VPDDRAPGDLETVRQLLLTSALPNDTRVPEDRLDDWVSEADRGEIAEVRRLREALIASLGVERPVALAPWLERYPLRIALQPDGRPVAFEPESPSLVGRLLAAVTAAVADGTWHRLHACPGCRYAFYDTSRNASRTWCRMTKEDASGRSCGSIAKARAKRERDRQAQPSV